MKNTLSISFPVAAQMWVVWASVQDFTEMDSVVSCRFCMCFYSSATGDMDMGRLTVCVQVTDNFLAYTRSVRNDLSFPMPQYNFPSLKENDIWCLCAQRWAQAYNAEKAPKLYLQAGLLSS